MIRYKTIPSSSQSLRELGRFLPLTAGWVSGGLPGSQSLRELGRFLRRCEDDTLWDEEVSIPS